MNYEDHAYLFSIGQPVDEKSVFSKDWIIFFDLAFSWHYNFFLNFIIVKHPQIAKSRKENISQIAYTKSQYQNSTTSIIRY